MIFEGKITFIGSEETVGANNTRKIVFVIEENTDGEFKKSIVCEQLGDKKVDAVKELKVGDIIKAHLDSRAREYNGRWYNSISAWRIDKGEGNSSDTSSDLPF